MDQDAAIGRYALPPKPARSRSMTDAQRDELEHQHPLPVRLHARRLHLPHDRLLVQVSPAMHRDVMALVAGGYSGAGDHRRVQSGVRRARADGAEERFNLVGYTMPFVALGTGAVVVAALLKRWKSRAAPCRSSAPHRLDATEGELAALDAAVQDETPDGAPYWDRARRRVALLRAVPAVSRRCLPGRSRVARARKRQRSAVDALRELEFDRETGKISDSDYEPLKARYTARPWSRCAPGTPVCERCGPRPEADAEFCSRCGSPLVA